MLDLIQKELRDVAEVLDVVEAGIDGYAQYLGVAAAVVNTFADGRVEMVPLQNIAVPEGKALEIWTLWDRAVGPRSVGLIDRARTTPLRLDQMPLGKDQLFEITIEPATGSPTGRPTGPIVAKGTTSQAL